MLAKTSRLEAVNTIIACVGESPVNSLDAALSSDAAVAINTLDEVLREVQTRGWQFNTEHRRLPRNSEGWIVVDPDVVRVDLSHTAPLAKGVAIRGDRLYDRDAGSYQFSGDLEASVVVMLPFEELPEPARRYIMVRAGRIFADRMVGAEKHHGFNLRDEMMAWADLRNFDDEASDRTMFDHYDVFRTLHRTR
jgi:hypothetical protein